MVNCRLYLKIKKILTILVVFLLSASSSGEPRRVLLYGDELVSGYHGRDKGRNDPRCPPNLSRSTLCRVGDSLDPPAHALAEMFQASSMPFLQSVELSSHGNFGWSATTMLERATERPARLAHPRSSTLQRTIGLRRVLEYDDESAMAKGCRHNCQLHRRSGFYDVIIIWAGSHDLRLQPSWATRHHEREGPIKENLTASALADTIFFLVEIAQSVGNCSNAVAVALAEDFHPSALPDPIRSRKRAKVNAYLRSRCEASARPCTFFDPWRRLLFTSDSARVFSRDGVHLNAAGYQAFARALYPIVRNALIKAAQDR